MDKLAKVVAWLRAASPYQKTFDSISRATGVNPHTLRKIRSGATKNPHFQLVDTLSAYIAELEAFAANLERIGDAFAALALVPDRLRVDRLDSEAERFEYVAEIVRMCSIVRRLDAPAPAVNPRIAETSSAGSDA